MEETWRCWVISPPSTTGSIRDANEGIRFLGITADEAYGGLGMGYQAHCVVMEEISRASGEYHIHSLVDFLWYWFNLRFVQEVLVSLMPLTPSSALTNCRLTETRNKKKDSCLVC